MIDKKQLIVIGFSLAITVDAKAKKKLFFKEKLSKYITI